MIVMRLLTIVIICAKNLSSSITAPLNLIVATFIIKPTRGISHKTQLAVN